MEIKTFNTGRQYSAQGQRIAYAVAKAHEETPGLEDYTVYDVYMYDADRGVHGVLRTVGKPTDRAVLASYDHDGASKYGHLPYGETMDALRAAAESI